ncbi:AraC family transcriptional regulator [Acinetobacter cumulans]|nr:AraC family transcriptional regulator [Acinetobacter cumulans]
MITSDAGVLIWQTYQTMQKMGLDVNRIYAGVKLPPEPPDKSIRRDNAIQKHFWAIAEEISGDPDIGLHTGEHFPIFRGEILEYLFLSSETLLDGFIRAFHYQKILTTSMQFELKTEAENSMIKGLNYPIRHYLECGICITLNFLHHISDQHFRAKEIWLPYTTGASQEEYQRIWKCPVKLGMPEGQIIFDSHLLSLPSASFEPNLLKMHEKIADQQLKIVEKYDLIYQIEQVMKNGLLEMGNISLALVAQALNINPRTLRADLQLIDTTFENILSHYREKTAKKLLINSQISIEQIVYLLGFSEPSAFSRAFKRWTNESPTQYRQRKLAELDSSDI